MARLRPICPAERTVIVVGEDQRRHVRRWPAYRRYGRVVFQPEDRGTGAGVLFGLLPVLAADPDGVVVLTPSDHGVRNTDLFRTGILEAVPHAQYPGGSVLFGVQPSAARTDYGWITLHKDDRRATIRRVASFVEKPGPQAAKQLLASVRSGTAWSSWRGPGSSSIFAAITCRT